MSDEDKNPVAENKGGKMSLEKRRREIEARADSALAAMEDLAEILSEENDAVLNRDNDTFEALQEEKVRGVEEYKKAMPVFETRQADMYLLSGAVRDPLRVTHAELEKVFAENIEILDVARHATGRVIGIIIEAARRAILPNERYDEDGALDPGSRGGPVGFDESL